MPLVSIRCSTYNHAPFIRQALDGFLMQETTFPVEILVHDDASTDGTAEIVKEYAEKFPALFRVVLQDENQYSKGIRAAAAFYATTKSQYLAHCEGDDCWTSLRKLQDQVDYLDANAGVVLCFHDVTQIDSDGKMICNSKIQKLNPAGQSKQLLGFSQVTGSMIPTVSIVRKNITIPEPPKRIRVRNGDLYLFGILSAYGEMHDIGKNMAAHRVHPGGIWSSAGQLQRLRYQVDTFHALCLRVVPKDVFDACECLAWQAFGAATIALRERELKLVLRFLSKYLTCFMLAGRVIYRMGPLAILKYLKMALRIGLIPFKMVKAKMRKPTLAKSRISV